MSIVREITQKITNCIERGNKIYLAGNGGSSAQASHFSEELISHGLPAIALNDPQVITALINDFPPKQVFLRYLKAISNDGDLFIAFTTSGKSDNLNEVKENAQELGIEYLEWPHKIGRTTENKQDNQLIQMHEVYKAVVKYFKDDYQI